MSDNTLRDRIARVSMTQRCCDECAPVALDYDLADALLAAPGITVVSLPERMTNMENVAAAIREWPMWQQHSGWAAVSSDGLIKFEGAQNCFGSGLDASEARHVAAALLAAANEAKEGR